MEEIVAQLTGIDKLYYTIGYWAFRVFPAMALLLLLFVARGLVASILEEIVSLIVAFGGGLAFLLFAYLIFC